MRIGVVQHEIVWESPQENYEALRPWIDKAAGEGSELIALSETFSWGFTMNTGVAAEPADGPSTEFLRTEAERVGAWVVGSIPILTDGHDRPNNRMVFASPSGDILTYDKVHPFVSAGETEHYEAGTTLHTFDIGGLRISPFVCFDIRFADEFWQLAHDTDCYLVIANFPAIRRNHWNTLLRARAIENQAWVVAANRVGTDPNTAYAGDSQVIDPFGDIVANAYGAPGVIVHDVTAERVATVRADYPFLPERR